MVSTKNKFAKIRRGLIGMFFFALLVFALPVPSFQKVSAQAIYTPTPMEIQTADQVISAVNSLRLASGLPPLNVHPILMQVAQWEVDALLNGANGHTRPQNMTLGQQLLSLGYPLSGDLSLDGYRSENVVWGPGFTVQDALRLWGSDDPHTNTMLSPNRSDLGAAVASGQDEWGFTVYYYVLETALQTNNGKMQYDAYPILTGIPQTQQAYSAMGTEAAKNGTLPQYMLAVNVSTALPNGDVIHQVQYGQTLWSIAITYHTTVKQIQQLNNLSDTTIIVGQKLLIARGATQPIPYSTPATSTPVTVTPTIPSPMMLASPTPFLFETPTVQSAYKFTEQDQRKNTLAVAAIVVAALFLGGVIVKATRKRDG